MDFLTSIFRDFRSGLLRKLSIVTFSMPGLYGLGRLGFNWYMGKYFKPKIYQGKFRDCKNLFYYEYKSPITEVSKYFYRFVISIYTNPGLNPNMGKNLKYKWRLWTFKFDDAAKL